MANQIPLAALSAVRYDPSSPSGLVSVATGNPIGSKQSAGYWQVRVLGVKYLAHRVVYALHHDGIDPEVFVDHRDTVRSNNLIANLRGVVRHQNQANMNRATNNVSGVKGLSWDATYCRWRAGVTSKGKTTARYFPGEASRHAAEAWLIETRTALHGAYLNHGVSK